MPTWRGPDVPGEPEPDRPGVLDLADGLVLLVVLGAVAVGAFVLASLALRVLCGA